MRSTHRRLRWRLLSSVFSAGKRPSRDLFSRRARFRVEGMEDRILLAAATYAAINLINSSGERADDVLDAPCPEWGKPSRPASWAPTM